MLLVEVVVVNGEGGTVKVDPLPLSLSLSQWQVVAAERETGNRH